jgi:hypothetical protein
MTKYTEALLSRYPELSGLSNRVRTSLLANGIENRAMVLLAAHEGKFVLRNGRTKIPLFGKLCVQEVMEWLKVDAE